MKKILSYTLFVGILIHFSVYASGGVQDDNWNGKEYHENSSSQKNAAKDLMNHIDLQGNECILDIGSGDGKITAAIAKRLTLGKIIGVDISPSMIEFATTMFPKKEYPNLEFKLMAAEDIDFNEVFDVILSFTTLQWIKDHPLVIAKVRNSLKPEGIFAATMPMGLPWALEKAVHEAMQGGKWSHYFMNFETGWNFVTAKEYKEYLQANEFSINRLEVVRHEDVFPSLAAFKGFVFQWFSYLRVLPINEKEKFLNWVLARYIELDPLDESGNLHFKVNCLEVVAQKK